MKKQEYKIGDVVMVTTPPCPCMGDCDCEQDTITIEIEDELTLQGLLIDINTGYEVELVTNKEAG